MTKPLGTPRHREKPWDIALTSEQKRLAFKNRIDPQGVQREVKFDVADPNHKRAYPWNEMEDGDWFWTPTGETSKHAQSVSFYQAAVRHDIEIQVIPMEMDGVPGFRVARIHGGIAKIKSRANGLGANIKISRGRRRGVTGGGDYPDGTDIASDADDAPGAPSSLVPEGYDRAAWLERAQRSAENELRGR